MADRIEAFTVTVTAGTTVTLPQDTPLAFNMGIVTDIEILVPPGCSGLVGFQLRHSGGTVIPYDASQWIVADNEVIKWPLRNFPVGEAWGLRAYNLDVYDHALFLRLLVDETTRQTVTIIEPIPISPVAPSEVEPVSEEVG